MSKSFFTASDNHLKSLVVKTLFTSLIFGITGACAGIILVSENRILRYIFPDPSDNIIMSRSLYQDMLHGPDILRHTWDIFASWSSSPLLPALILVLISLACIILLMWFGNRDSSCAAKTQPFKTGLVWTAGLFLCLTVFYLFFSSIGDEFWGIRPYDWPEVSALCMVLFGPLLCGVFFIATGEGGLISWLAGEKRSLGGAFLRGVLAGALIVPLAMFSRHYAGYFYELRSEFWPITEAAEMTRLGFQRINMGVALWGGLFFAATGGAFISMAPRNILLGPRLRALTIPFVSIALVLGAGQGFVSHCNTAWEMGKDSLNEAASLIVLPQPPAPRVQLVLRDAKDEKGEAVELRNEDGMDMIPENIGRLDSYLEERKDSPTYFTGQAMELRREIAAFNWLIEEFREICLKNSLEKGNSLNSFILVASLDHAPVTSRNRELLETLSNDKLFFLSGWVKLRMAQVWGTHGDIETARKWYDRAKKELSPEDIKRWTVPLEAGLTDGKLLGQIKGVPAKGTKVGLYRLREYATSRRTQLYFYLHPVTIKAAKDLESDGTFVFAHIPEGRYFLVLLLPSGQKGPFDVTGGGIIELNKKRPVIDIGEIQVVHSS